MTYPANLPTIAVRHKIAGTSGRDLGGSWAVAVLTGRLWTNNGSIVPTEYRAPVQPDGSYEFQLPPVDHPAIVGGQGEAYQITEPAPTVDTKRPDRTQTQVYYIAPVIAHGDGPIDATEALVKAPAGREVVIHSGPVTDASAAELVNRPGGVFAASLKDTIDTSVAAARHWRGILVAGTDLNTITAPGQYGLNSSAYPGKPFTGAGTLMVSVLGGAAQQQTAISWTGEVFTRYSSGTTWVAWTRIDSQPALPQNVTGSINLDEQRGNLERIIPSGGTGITGGPDGVTGGPAHFRSRATLTGITFHTLHTYGGGGATYYRQTSGVGSSPFPWTPWRKVATTADIPAPAPPSTVADHAGITNMLLVQDWSRRRGGRKRITTGAVAFRFDHGLANFNTKLRPLLEARGIPYSLALNGGNWANAENAGVTAATVNGWVQGGLCEVWNHGLTHAGTKDPATWENEIVGGLDKLRADLPDAQIDGFAIPSLQNIGYGDFQAGWTIDEFYATPAGRRILATHAVTTGYLANTWLRVLDGEPRQGQLHMTMDKHTLANAQANIDAAIAQKRGAQFMIHPSLVDTPDHIATATFEQILDYVVQKRDADELAVLGPYDLMLADVT